MSRAIETPPARRSTIRKLTRPQFDDHASFIVQALGRHSVRRLSTVYKEFGGDIAKAIILGEVAHHNLSNLAPSVDYDRKRMTQALKSPVTRAALLPCNAFSISEATGIPRETVRRKTRELVAEGLLERVGRNDLYLRSDPSVYGRFDTGRFHEINDTIELVARVLARVHDRL
ncbi:MAG: hypothetical protein MUE61_17560 [Vicinamibacterales bacterium]|jgi:hypothetical protein|nr:hypothetical protein [Vicinamibacterales bacterium]